MKTERHGYKFTNKYNTRGGIISTILAVITLAVLIAGIMLSYQKKGNAGIMVGALGTAAFVFSMAGMVYGLRSFKEKDGFYFFSWLGTISNTILWLVICAIIVMGIMMF